MIRSLFIAVILALVTNLNAQEEPTLNCALSQADELYHTRESKRYSLYITGTESLVNRLVDIINRELPSGSYIDAEPVTFNRNEYGISFQGLQGHVVTTRQDRFNCAMHFLLRDSIKSIRIQLVENDKYILIANGQKAILDIADIEKFDSSGSEDFTAGIVLLHELHEQYYAQKVKNYKPGKLRSYDLRSAHLRALQKESAIYNINMTKTSSAILNYYIEVVFQNRIDNSKDNYKAYYKRGNIERVVKTDNSGE